jgi:hypothetical protein
LSEEKGSDRAILRPDDEGNQAALDVIAIVQKAREKSNPK